ncbi:MAG: DUF2850 domain-containing protein, partial [Actinomycetes bacterium]
KSNKFSSSGIFSNGSVIKTNFEFSGLSNGFIT